MGGGGGGGGRGTTAAASPRAEPAGGGASAGARAGAVASTTLSIMGPRELWFGGGGAPAGNDASRQLRSNRAGGTFRWTASPNLALSATTDPAPTMAAVAASIAVDDAWIRLVHTDAGGATTVASYRLTIIAPAGPDPARDAGEPVRPEPALAHATFLHYAILDQFGVALPRSVRLGSPAAAGRDVAVAARRRSRGQARHR